MMYGGFIRHWSSPLSVCLEIYADGIEPSLLGGDVETHGYLRYGHGSYALMAGQPLGQVTEFLEEHLAAVTAVRHEKTRRIMTMALNSLYRMQGRVYSEPFDEDESTRVWTEGADATSLSYHHKYKMLEALMRADYAEVHRQALDMKANERGIVSMAFDPYYQFTAPSPRSTWHARWPCRAVWSGGRAQPACRGSCRNWLGTCLQPICTALSYCRPNFRQQRARPLLQ